MAVEWASRVIYTLESENPSAVSEIFCLLSCWVVSTYLHLYLVQVASIDLASISALVALANFLGDFFWDKASLSLLNACCLESSKTVHQQ